MKKEDKQKIWYLENIIDLVPGNIYWLSRDGIFLGCNENQLKLLGLNSKKDYIGKTYEDLLESENAKIMRETDEKIMRSGETLALEEPGFDLEGKPAIYSAVKRPLFNKEGNVIGLLGVSVDITERKKLENRLIAAKVSEKANKTKSKFIANMSHDLRTPLTGMLGIAQDLLQHAEHVKSVLEGTAPTKLSSDDVDLMLHDLVAVLEEDGTVLFGATDELLQLCNDILEVVRLDSGEIDETPEAFDVREVALHIKELLEPMARHQLLDFTVEVDDHVPQYVYGLRNYLDRILLNLTGNALKFTEQGLVKVDITLAEGESLSYQNGDTVNLHIRVEDTGIGIPEDQLDFIFDYFSRLSASYKGIHKGSGLGLYTVKQYIGAMEGDISVESEVGKGSVFEVTLPFVVSDHSDYVRQSVRPLPAATPTKKREVVAPEEAYAHVLVVEDNSTIAKAVSLELAGLHCTTDIAETGEEALEKVAQTPYDFIFMDIGLPGMDGIEVTKKIRALKDKEKSQIPIVALTAHVDAKAKEACYSAGMEGVLNKPASVSQLGSVLQEYVPSFGEVAIDWPACVKIYNNNEAMTKEMMKTFGEVLKSTESILEKAYQEKDIGALRDELHRAIGGVYYMRVPELEKTLKAFQAAVKAKPQNAEEMESTYQDLQKAIKRFWVAYEKVCGE